MKLNITIITQNLYLEGVVNQLLIKSNLKQVSINKKLTPYILLITDLPEIHDNLMELLYQTKFKIIADFSNPQINSLLTFYQKNKLKRNHPDIIDYSKTKLNFPIKSDLTKSNAAAIVQLGLALDINPSLIIETL